MQNTIKKYEKKVFDYTKSAKIFRFAAIKSNKNSASKIATSALAEASVLSEIASSFALAVTRKGKSIMKANDFYDSKCDDSIEMLNRLSQTFNELLEKAEKAFSKADSAIEKAEKILL